MIRLIGTQRLLVLFALLMLNGVLAGVIFGYIDPLYQDAQQQKRRVEGEIRDMRNAIQNIKSEMEQLEKNKQRYEDLRDNKGFFLKQDRFMLRRLMDENISWARLVNAPWKVSPLEAVSNAEAQKIEKQLVRSEIEVSLEAFLDTDVFSYLDRINKEFPGQTRLIEMSLERGEALTNDALTSVANGRPVAFVKGKMLFEWYTLVGKEDISEIQENSGGRR